MSAITIRRAIHKARKAYVCDFCTSAINPGDRYDREDVPDRGRVHTWRTCLPCVPVVREAGLWWNDLDEGVLPEEVRDWASENPDDPGAVAFLARRDAARAVTA